jgi:hypothetical protein
MIRLLVNNSPVDLSDNFDILISKSIADIKSPETRSSEWTKTVVVPGTRANNKLFSHIFEVEQTIQGTTQFAPDFNPNKKADVVVLLDEIEQMRGFIRLIQINVLDSTDIQYECSLHGKTADLFTNISDLKLNQLDFTEYNHILSSGNIIDSWDTTIYKNGTTQAFSYGEGYVYAMIDKGHPTNIAVWETKQFTPCLYAKTVIDKIFTNSGFSYTNDSYFNSTDFKRLVIPNPSPLSADASVLEGRRFKASRITTSQSLDLNSVLLFQNDSTGGNYDNGNNYNTTTGQYTLPVGGDYAFDLDLLMLFQSTGYFPVLSAEIWLVFGLYVNGVLKDTLIVTPNIGSNTNRQLTLFPFTLLQGSVVDIRLVQVYDDANKVNLTNAQFSLDLLTTSFIESNQSSYTFGVGETVNFSMFLNSEVKQSEMLMSFVKMFNLYIEPDPDQPKILRIVPRDDFYNGSQVDWTKKLDYSQPVEIIPMGDLDANPYVFTYKEGKDETNVSYQQNYQTTYGSRTYKVDNQFIKTEKKIEIAFSPTQIKSYNSQKNFVLSYMPNSQDGDLRIMYYSGLVDGVNWRLWNQYAGVGLVYSYLNKLPLTLHYNSITDPTFDILFGMPREIGIGAGYKYANVNLVNKFYYKFLTEITSKNSKLVRAYFRITPSDWLNLSFADAYFFEGQYWRLNKIEDYNPIDDGVYLCEFLLAQFVAPATITTKTIGAGTAQGQQGETLGDIYPGGNNPIQPGIKGVNIGLGKGGAGVIQGDNIVQNQNTVDAFCVVSTNTTFQAGTDGSAAILCEDFTVTKSDTLYVGNYEMYPNFLSGGFVQTITTTTTATADDYMFLCDTTAGSFQLNLPSPTGLSGKLFVVKKINAGHTLTVATIGTAKIDGADDHALTGQWSSHIITTNGTDYFII